MNDNISMDIYENEIMRYGEPLLNILLFDRTTRQNIVWGTANYAHLGEAYDARLPITADLITGAHEGLIQPYIFREQTSPTTQNRRRTDIITPSWMCNEQNNLVDKAWFGREGVFNTSENKGWLSTREPIPFANKSGKRWRNYVDAKRLEITCGEAPYLVSRYDTLTGSPIEVGDRIGLLDRKLRVVCENAHDENEWLKWATRAFQSVYAFEFQGDSLLIARENLLLTFVDYLRFQFDREPTFKELRSIANIISWNLWQMDGLHFSAPFRAVSEQYHQLTIEEMLSGGQPEPCLCKIRDWRSKRTVTYASLVRRQTEI